jgi:hypothetical protein
MPPFVPNTSFLGGGWVCKVGGGGGGRIGDGGARVHYNTGPKLNLQIRVKISSLSQCECQRNPS